MCPAEIWIKIQGEKKSKKQHQNSSVTNIFNVRVCSCLCSEIGYESATIWSH